jgi:MFS family permease
MKKRQLVSLLICSFVVWTLGNGSTPLLPLYIGRFGANKSTAGYFLAGAFFCLAAGTFVAGWFSDRFQRRKLILIVAGVVCAPFTFLMGRVDRVWQLAVVTGISWFCGGAIIAVINILAGLFAAEDRRGQVFGLIGVTIGLGALVGGLSFGRLVDYRGYTFLFSCLGVFVLVGPAVGLLLEDKTVRRESAEESKKSEKRLPAAFYFLLVAHFLAFTTNSAVNFGRSLAMDQLGYSSSAIASTMAASGVMMIFAPPIIGWLSDRIGRKPFLLFCYFVFALSAVAIAFASFHWQFYAALALLSLGAVSTSVGAAFVSDLVPPELLGTGMSVFQNTIWLGAMVGFAVSGNLLMQMSIRRTFLFWTVFPIAALVLVSFIPKRRRVVAE